MNFHAFFSYFSLPVCRRRKYIQVLLPGNDQSFCAWQVIPLGIQESSAFIGAQGLYKTNLTGLITCQVGSKSIFHNFFGI